GFDGGDDDNQAQAQATATQPPATATAVPTSTPEPEPTPQPNRESCSEILGTAYLSDAEHAEYQENCTGTAAGGGGRPYTGGGVEFYMGDRLVIPNAGVHANVTGIKVGVNGVMSDPVGYFNAVWYDFSS